jgi:parallel beta-helix repeat protein
MLLGKSHFRWFVSLVLLAAFLGASNALAFAAPQKTFQVFPGKNAITKALNKANNGDTLMVHQGIYRESLQITQDNLTLESAGDGIVTINARCNSANTIQVLAENVTIRGLNLLGASEYTIDIEGISKATVRGNTLTASCSGVEYGVNVFNSGAIKVTNNTASGFADAGIYIGGINATPSPLVVKNNNSHHNTRGVIVENSGDVTIRVIGNNFHDNSNVGIWVHNSDGTLYNKNTATNNSESGIHLDGTSDDNTVTNNSLSSQTYDIWNEGSGNCFASNTYTTHSGPISSC